MDNFQPSVADYLIKLFPDLTYSPRKTIDTVAANDLFKIWRNETNKTGKSKYIRTPTTPIHTLDRIKKAGFIKLIGNEIEITEKGASIIKIMILGDQKSIFEDDNSVIDYGAALSQSEHPLKTAKKISKNASDNWWSRFK